MKLKCLYFLILHMLNDLMEVRCFLICKHILTNLFYFQENYGVNDKDAIDNVLELYYKTNLLERFEDFDNQLSTEISTLIESMDDIKGALFYDLFAQLRKREK